MKKVFTILAAVLLTANVFLPKQAGAQSPEKMSYQAVVRDGSNNLVSSAAVGMQISILQGSASGTAVYTETQTPTTNANGFVSLEIGNGTVVSGNFTTIDWANNIYFIKTETDPAGGTNYTITGTSQIMSVPYALHSKTAESISGDLNEADPVFGESAAAGITATDISTWNNKLDNYTETDPVFVNSVAGGITEEDLANWNNGGFTETDPDYSASQASNITAGDITNLSNLSGTNTGDQDISGIATNATAITALQTEQATQDEAIALNTAKLGGGITTEQADAITANTAKVGITTEQADAITANTAKVGITTVQADAITANTAKVGITTEQADAITANTAKVRYYHRAG